MRRTLNTAKRQCVVEQGCKNPRCQADHFTRYSGSKHVKAFKIESIFQSVTLQNKVLAIWTYSGVVSGL